MSTKSIQFDLFLNEAASRERLEREKKEESIQKSIRALFYRVNELENVVLDHQKIIEAQQETIRSLAQFASEAAKIMDYLEKTPDR